MPVTFRVPRDEFLAGLASLQNVTGKKGTIAILSNILIEAANNSVHLTGTDLEVGIRYTVPGEVLAEGSLTLPARKLFELVRESAADSLLVEELDNSWARITAEATDYNLAGMASEEFPAFPAYDEHQLVEVSSDLLKDLIDRTIFSVAQEGESQFNLTGVLVEREILAEGDQHLRMVSSDGHRLTMMERKAENDLSGLAMERTILIPRKGMQEIGKFCEGKESLWMGFEEKQAVIKSDRAVMVIRLMNGDFPDYKSIVQAVNKAKYIEIPRIPLMHSLKRMNLFTEDRYHAVQFNLEKDKLILSSQNMDLGSAKDELSIAYQDEPLQLGFNGKYFIDAMQVMTSEQIKAYINSEESPCLIQGDDDPGYLAVIMPMKI